MTTMPPPSSTTVSPSRTTCASLLHELQVLHYLLRFFFNFCFFLEVFYFNVFIVISVWQCGIQVIEL
jgi:hypothetical protein